MEIVVKTVADWIALWIVSMFIVSLIVFFMGRLPRWDFKESPETGICYEVREVLVMPFMGSSAMSPVDGSYCEEE